MIGRDFQLNEIMWLIKHFPDGEYTKIVYWSKYENKRFISESFLLVKEGGRWGVLSIWFM